MIFMSDEVALRVVRKISEVARERWDAVGRHRVAFLEVGLAG